MHAVQLIDGIAVWDEGKHHGNERVVRAGAASRRRYVRAVPKLVYCARPLDALDCGMTTRELAAVRLPSRAVSWGFNGLFLLAHALWATAMNLGFRARVPGLDTLTANLLALVLLVAGLLVVVGRLRPGTYGCGPVTCALGWPSRSSTSDRCNWHWSCSRTSPV